MAYNQQERDPRYEAADHVDLLEYARSSGYELSREGREYCLKIHDSLSINPEKNNFMWHSRGKGGGPVQFVMMVENKTVKEAVDILIGREHKPISRPKAQPKLEEKIPFVLPEKNDNYRRLFAYLTKTRCIDPETVQDMVNRKLIYESKDYHNCVFVSYDSNGQAKSAFMRGTVTPQPGKKSFKCEVPGSEKEDYPFLLKGSTNRLYLYEGAIDAISDITLSKLKGIPAKDHHRMAMGGLNPNQVMSYLKGNPQINLLVIRTDNDDASKKFIRDNGGELLLMGVAVKADLPQSKDINQDLQNFCERGREDDAMGQ